jgi:hypothetical protein
VAHSGNNYEGADWRFLGQPPENRKTDILRKNFKLFS